MAFGSAVRGLGTRNLDHAVEFEADIRADGYSDAEPGLLTDRESSLATDVDAVAVSGMSPRFAQVGLDKGVVVNGTDTQRGESARRTAGELPPAAEVRDASANTVGELQSASSPRSRRERPTGHTHVFVPESTISRR